MKPQIDTLIRFLFYFTLFLLVMNFFPRKISESVANEFFLDGEKNVPTWFSTILLYSVSLVSLVIYYFLRHREGDINSYRFWLVFGAAFIFLSLDEQTSIHEILDKVLPFKWVYPYLAGGIIFFIYTFKSLKKNPLLVTRRYVISGILILAAGGMILELISHILYPLPHHIQSIEFVMEEGCEMAGVIIILYGCLIYLDSIMSVDAVT